ncbi:hypothetical protein [Clostridium aquiflavi]|uniref:Uncharacterized protein n=1 Tax=Clostridium aquiflavi TaxID=3073603 RepID=A0ABU1EKU3_9CLOT|nr:hypothetical protein [Clostridium sp. 5N-1]MDR5588692.1 hypothetical protein [Clostridium sp. 5N-1]
MELMYIKYKNNIKSTTIKDGNKLIRSEAKVIPLRNKENFKKPKTYYSNISNKVNDDDKTNEKITNFFFNAIHKNYLANKKRF